MADNVYNLKFTLSNGDVIDAGQITAPQGPKGDKGDSATIDANTLLALLSASNGIEVAKNTAGDKVEVGISRSGFELGTFSTDRTGIEFVCSDTTQTINFISPDGDGLLICNMMDSTRSSIILLGSSGEGTLIAYNDITYTLDSSSSEEKHYLREGNVKTLFGNQQSIYGSGNIDLYRHNVWFTGVSGSSTIVDCVLTFISSSNTAIDSLTSLFSVIKPMVSSGGTYPVNGRVYNTNNSKYYVATRIYPTSDGAVIANTTDEEKWFAWNTLGTLTLYDKVTTV